MTWAPRLEHYGSLKKIHRGLLLQIIGYHRVCVTYRQLSYAKALEKTRVVAGTHYPRFGASSDYRQLEQQTTGNFNIIRSVKQIAVRMFQYTGVVAMVTRHENACNHNPIHAVRTSLNSFSTYHSLGTLYDSDDVYQRPRMDRTPNCRGHRAATATAVCESPDYTSGRTTTEVTGVRNTRGGGEDPGPGCLKHIWLKCLRDDLQASVSHRLLCERQPTSIRS